MYREREELETISAIAVTEALKRNDPEKIAGTLARIYEQIIAEDTSNCPIV